MPIPADQMARAAALLVAREDKVPPEVRDMLKLCHRTEGNSILLFEFRSSLMRPGPWHEEMVAKFTYVKNRKCWRLFWMRSDLKWHSYHGLPVARTFGELFHEVDTDPLCCFFG